MDEKDKERLRMELEDAVIRALEAGLSKEWVLDEVNYAVDSYDDA